MDRFRQLAYAGDPVHKYGHRKQEARAIAVERNLVSSKAYGSHGQSPVLKQLSYLDADNLWYLPVAHAALYGVVKDFWNFMLEKQAGGVSPSYGLDNSTRRLLSARAISIKRTLDFNRPYRDVVQSRGSYTMEDWLHFTETYSVAVLAPTNGNEILKEPFATMWSLLRAVIIHLFRASRLQHENLSEASRTAHDSLVKYGKLLEQHIGPRACKYNLHVLICRALNQEDATGLISMNTEFWVERAVVRQCKKIPRERAPKNPEILLVNSLSLAVALQNNLNEFYSELKDEEAKCQGINKDLSCIRISRPDESTPSAAGEFFIGSGRIPSETGKLGLGSAWEKYRQEWPGVCRGWQAADILDAKTTIYKRLLLKGQELVNSSSYIQETERESFYCLVRFEEPCPASNDPDAAHLVTYVAKLKYFVLMKKDADDFDPIYGDDVISSFRLACCDLYEAEPCNMPQGQFYKVSATSPAKEQTYLVDVGKLDFKVMFCNFTEINGNFFENLWLFLPYVNVQSYTEDDLQEDANLLENAIQM